MAIEGEKHKFAHFVFFWVTTSFIAPYKFCESLICLVLIGLYQSQSLLKNTYVLCLIFQVNEFLNCLKDARNELLQRCAAICIQLAL